MIIKCPNCGESYYAEKYSSCTAIYSPTIWHDGEVTNSDPNIRTTYCECINCHYTFHYETQYGKVIGTYLDEKITPIPTIEASLIDINGSDTISKDYVTLSSNAITINQPEARDAEIRRLEQQIESLKQQLQEVKANPEWRVEVHV